MAELGDGVEQRVKEREASFILRSVAWVTVQWWHHLQDGNGGGEADTGTGSGWRDEFRFERVK